jgi:hypothetical protein
MQNSTLPAGSDTLVCYLVYNASKEIEIKDKILVLTNNSNPALATLEIPYLVSVNELLASVSDAEKVVFVLPTRSMFSIPRESMQKKSPDDEFEAFDNRRVYDFYDEEAGAYPSSYKVKKSVSALNKHEGNATILSIKVTSCTDILTVLKWPDTLTVESNKPWGPIIIEADVAKALHRMKNDEPVICSLRFDSDHASYESPVLFVSGNLKYLKFGTVSKC